MPSSGMICRVALVSTDVFRLLVSANAVPSSPILFPLITEMIRSSETFVLTRATQSIILENGILHIHSRENIESYIINNRDTGC
jgi:hypothetical protein